MGQAGNESGKSSDDHRWRFFRVGGFDQVRIETGQDLASLAQLDQKLWMALSCPVTGLEFDQKTLEMIDTDHDGRIRVPEIIAAVSWAVALLKNPDDLLKGSAELPLAAINDETAEGKKLLSSAQHILANLGKEGATTITPTDTADTERIFAQTRFNGDGIVPPDAAENHELQQIIGTIIDCCGAERDRSGKPGVSQEKVDIFYADLQRYADWHEEAAAPENGIRPLGDLTDTAFAALNTVRAKAEDYFARCRLAAFDNRALSALNLREEEYLAIAGKDLSNAAAEISGFPLAIVAAGRPLPLREGVNPVWADAVSAFTAAAVVPLLGERDSLTEAEWHRLQTTFAAYEGWLSRKPATVVEN
ncbi:MAG TPA: hypothetical protein PKV74_08395, partial [Syntrophales bacterium]|nr:hypothetical protein [Syntrophales bacterium]